MQPFWLTDPSNAYPSGIHNHVCVSPIVSFIGRSSREKSIRFSDARFARMCLPGVYLLGFCYAWILVVVFASGSRQVILLTVHVGANPLYGFYAAAPVYTVAIGMIRKLYPEILGNITHLPIYLPGYDLCQDGGDHVAEFFTEFYLRRFSQVNRSEVYIVLASPECTNQVLPLGDLSRELDLPFLVSAGGDSRLTNRKRFPTMTMTTPLAGADVLAATAAFLQRFNWRTLSLVCDFMSQYPGLSNFYFARCNDIRRYLIDQSYDHYYVQFDSANEQAFASYLGGLKNRSRVFLILTTPTFLRQLMIAASQLGMTRGDFVFVSVQPTRRPGIQEVTWKRPEDAHNNQIARRAFQSLVVLTGVTPVWNQIRNLTKNIARMATSYYNFTYSREDEENDMQICIYEAVMMFAQVFAESYPAVLSNWSTTFFMTNFANRTFSFAERNFTTDNSGSKINPVVVLRLDPTTESMEQAMIFEIQSKQYQHVRNDLWYWVNRNSSPPDRPPCGFSDDQCETSSVGKGIVVGLVITFVLLLFLAAGIALYLYLQRRTELLSLWWLLPLTAVSYDSMPDNLSVLKASLSGNSVLGESCRYQNQPAVSFKLLTSKSDTVQVKDLVANKKLLVLLYQIRYLRDGHVATLYGLTLSRNELLLISEVGHRGTLRDLLDDYEKLVLDKSLKYSLCWDLLEGLEYIHRSPLKTHGRLSSLTCIVDSRFTLKICQVGYNHLIEVTEARVPDSDTSDSVDPELIQLTWKPVEVIRHRRTANFQTLQRLSNTVDCDVYALGVVVYEILTGQYPNDVDFDSPYSVIHTLRAIEEYGSMKMDERIVLPKEVTSMLLQCFEPKQTRASLKTVKRRLEEIRPRFADLVGHIVRRMEHRTFDLECIVAERTAEIEAQAQCTDKILTELLPINVVKHLRNKQTIGPEYFDNATIMFCDFPVMAQMTLHCSAADVIAVANRLQAKLDQMLVEFDICKIRTTGDAYCVASGIPNYNGGRHPFEIARLALSLLNETSSETANLRVGIHTGPVGAGVIMTKLPQYFLFGETMQEALRVRNTGAAGRVHVSSETMARLSKSSTFKLIPASQSNDLIEQSKTYWLVDRTG